MKVTVEFLKKESVNFDLECVYTLDLSRKGIDDLDQIRECVNIEMLDLSYNDISDVSVLKTLTSLKYLNLTSNQIRHLNGLEYLTNLKSLNLSGNLIDSSSEFFKLKCLENLSNLVVVDERLACSNPVVGRNRNYRNEISSILPMVRVIDGQAFVKSDKDLLKNLDDILNDLKRNTKRSSTHLEQSSTDFRARDVNQSLLAGAPTDKHLKEIQEEKEKFIQLHSEIKKSIELSNSMLKKGAND